MFVLSMIWNALSIDVSKLISGRSVGIHQSSLVGINNYLSSVKEVHDCQ